MKRIPIYPRESDPSYYSETIQLMTSNNVLPVMTIKYIYYLFKYKINISINKTALLARKWLRSTFLRANSTARNINPFTPRFWGAAAGSSGSSSSGGGGSVIVPSSSRGSS